MNLTSFLKQIDETALKCSKEQLLLFIHNVGRVLPETQRDDFLKRLKSVEGNAGKTPDRTGSEEFNEVYQHIRGNLRKIDSQEISIKGILNEEYDDWYNSSDEEFYYQDGEGIADMLEEACIFVHSCVDEERYQEGSSIGQQLFMMEILCENEYSDEEFDIGDMVHYQLLDYDMKQIILDTLYCIYQATPLKERPKALYEVVVNAKHDDISLEAVMQHGEEELPEFREFLPEWICYLGRQTGADAEYLFSEAVEMLGNVSEACKYADDYADNHPGTYLHILENTKSIDADKLIEIGLHAMKVIPKKYRIRSKVALKTADYIVQSDKHQAMLEECYFTAYESDTSAVNYIRAFLNGYGTEEKRQRLRNIFESLSTEENRCYFQSERQENTPDRNMIWLLRFLDGQFTLVLSKGMGEQSALGWTGTFMKQGIALFLLYFHGGTWQDEGIHAMVGKVKSAMGFSKAIYEKGLSETSDGDENDLFYHLFSEWKSMVGVESGVRGDALQKIGSLLERRVDGIMSANRRNYYGECAAYIAALGTVQESNGDKGAKQRLMTSYKERYSRRSAFRAELKAYGWKG